MKEEAKKLWELVKNKINNDGLIDLARYFPELAEEVTKMIETRKKINCSD